MQCVLYQCGHKQAGAWPLLLLATEPPPTSWPGVTIRCVGYFESEVEAVEILREFAADACMQA